MVNIKMYTLLVPVFINFPLCHHFELRWETIGFELKITRHCRILHYNHSAFARAIYFASSAKMILNVFVEYLRVPLI